MPQTRVLLHLHPDFQQPLEEVLKIWNRTQTEWYLVGIRPRRGP